MVEADLPACRDINRAAFSDFLGLPEPAAFRPGADVLGPRWRQWPEAGLVAERDGLPAGAGVLANALSSILGRHVNRSRELDATTVTVVSMGIGAADTEGTDPGPQRLAVGFPFI